MMELFVVFKQERGNSGILFSLHLVCVIALVLQRKVTA